MPDLTEPATSTTRLPAPSAATLSKVSKKLLPLLIAIYILCFLDRTNIGLAKGDLEVDLGIGAAAYGLGAGLFFLSYALFEVPSNIILSKVGARRWIFRIGLTWGIIAIAMAFVWNDWSFYAGRLLLGAAEAGLYPGVMYYLAQWFPHMERARIQGLFILGAPIASIVGSPIGGALLQLDGIGGIHGWQWMFVIEGVPSLVLAFVVLKLLPDRPSVAKWLDPVEAKNLEAFVAQENQSGADRTGNHRFRDLIRDRQIIFIAIAYFATQVAVYSIAYFLPSIIGTIGTFSPFQIGLLTSVPWIFGAIGAVILTRRARARNNSRTWIIICLAGTIVGLIVAVAAGGWVGFAAFCFFGFFMVADQALLLGLVGLRLNGTLLAVGLAMVNTFGLLGGFVGPYAMGAIEAVTKNPVSGIWLIAGLSIVGIIFSLFLARVTVQRIEPTVAVDVEGTR